MFEASINFHTLENDAGDIAGVELIKEVAVGKRSWPANYFNNAEDGEYHQD